MPVPITALYTAAWTRAGARRLVLWGLLCIGLSGPAEARDGFAEVPPDRSLTAEQYVARGLPLPADDWGPQEVERALRVLDELADEDPALLPRYRSERSGALFEKLLAETLTQSALARDDTAVPLDVYAPSAERGVVFDREWVAIQHAVAEACLRVVGESAAVGAEVDGWLAGGEEGSESLDRLKGMAESQQRIREAYGRRLLAAIEQLATLCELEGASLKARVEARTHAEELLNEAAPLLGDEGAVTVQLLRDRLGIAAECEVPEA